VVDYFRNLLRFPRTGLHEVALILALSALASQVLALARDRIFAHMFGASSILDVYYAAFKIPDIIFVTVASLVSATVLIPYFSREYAKDKDEAKKFLDSIFSVFIIALVFIEIIVFFLVPKLSHLIAPGFSEPQRLELINLTRILLLSPLLLGISGHVASIVQSFRYFFVYALSPILYNIGIIFGAIVLYPKLGVKGLVWGVVCGALGHLLIQWPTLIRTGYIPRMTTNINWPKVKEVFFVSIPRTITLGTSQLATLVLTSIASLLPMGSIAIYNLSFNLQSVPLSIVGVSFSMAAFPTLSALYVSGDRNKFVEQVAMAARQIIFWSLPLTSLFVVLRAQIVRVILGSGQFNWTHTRLVAASLALFAISLVAQSLVLLFVRGYYASGSTKTPLYSNIISGLLIVVLALVLIYSHRHFYIFRYFIESLLRVTDVGGTEVLMLPLAYSSGLVFNLFLHWIYFVKEFGKFPSMISRSLRQAIYSSVMVGFVAYETLGIFGSIFNQQSLLGIFAQGLSAGFFGIVAGTLLLMILGNDEVKELWATLHAKFWRTNAILPPPGEVPTA